MDGVVQIALSVVFTARGNRSSFLVVRFLQLPYSQMDYDSGDEDITLAPEMSEFSSSTEVADLRDQYQADLVQMVGYFPGTCGAG